MSDVDVESVLSRGGILSRNLDGYEHRPQQIEMAKGVEKALSESSFYVVEAATGTGKSMAYLIPAIASDKTVVVSTGTKALQDQLTSKDIPFLMETLPDSFDAVQLKGYSNYLCKRDFSEMKEAGQIDIQGHSEKVIDWADKTSSGEISELSGLPENAKIWSKVTTSSFGCTGSLCPHIAECFVKRSRDRAENADVIVVNHHLMLLDAQIREIFGEEAAILPNFDTIIFDEAHHLSDVATSCFSHELNVSSIGGLRADIENIIQTHAMPENMLHDFNATLKNASKRLNSAVDLLSDHCGNGRWSLKEVMLKMGDDDTDLMSRTMESVEDNISTVQNMLNAKSERFEELSGAKNRTESLMKDIKKVKAVGDESYAHWFDNPKGERVSSIGASPINVSSYLEHFVWRKMDTAVLTSATLSTKDSVAPLTKKLGLSVPLCKSLNKKASSCILPPVFDYPNQCGLFVPNNMSTSQDDNFAWDCAEKMEELVEIMGGGAFLLFTSRKNMNAVHEILSHRLEQTTFKQGHASKQEITERFKDDGDAVLFATKSFWEGVDIPGDALRLIVIDKLPFGSHLDPLNKARNKWVDSNGGNYFSQVMLPTAAIDLKQGFGRLIRTKKDKGVVAVLDSRIKTKGYGSYFTDTLPDARMLNSTEEVNTWWSNKKRKDD